MQEGTGGGAEDEGQGRAESDEDASMATTVVSADETRADQDGNEGSQIPSLLTDRSHHCWLYTEHAWHRIYVKSRNSHSAKLPAYNVMIFLARALSNFATAEGIRLQMPYNMVNTIAGDVMDEDTEPLDDTDDGDEKASEGTPKSKRKRQ